MLAAGFPRCRRQLARKALAPYMELRSEVKDGRTDGLMEKRREREANDKV